MPHSSGGGSHGGGSHSSSSSSHSSGGSHSGGSYSTIRKYYFPGASTYVRYDDDGNPDYIYSSSRSLNKPASKWRFIFILFYLPFFIGVFSMMKSGINIPKKIPTKYNTTIRIEDNLKVVKDEEHLRKRLIDFLDETGISVSLLTCTNDLWRYNYDSMEILAYDMYVTRFPDESHWLIVYSSDLNRNFEDWYFEGMQGNDTDSILTKRITDIFNEKLTKYLMQGDSIDRALEKALSDIEHSGLMKTYVNPATFLIGLAFMAFVTLHMMVMVHDPNRKYRKYILCSPSAKEERCDYCGSPYWPGTVSACPHCGAPIKTDKISNEVQSNG